MEHWQRSAFQRSGSNRDHGESMRSRVGKTEKNDCQEVGSRGPLTLYSPC